MTTTTNDFGFDLEAINKLYLNDGFHKLLDGHTPNTYPGGIREALRILFADKNLDAFSTKEFKDVLMAIKTDGFKHITFRSTNKDRPAPLARTPEEFLLQAITHIEYLQAAVHYLLDKVDPTRINAAPTNDHLEEAKVNKRLQEVRDAYWKANEPLFEKLSLSQLSVPQIVESLKGNTLTIKLKDQQEDPDAKKRSIDIDAFASLFVKTNQETGILFQDFVKSFKGRTQQEVDADAKKFQPEITFSKTGGAVDISLLKEEDPELFFQITTGDWLTSPALVKRFTNWIVKEKANPTPKKHSVISVIIDDVPQEVIGNIPSFVNPLNHVKAIVEEAIKQGHSTVTLSGLESLKDLIAK